MAFSKVAACGTDMVEVVRGATYRFHLNWGFLQERQELNKGLILFCL